MDVSDDKAESSTADAIFRTAKNFYAPSSMPLFAGSLQHL